MNNERIIPSSDLILNEDGSVFHLHLLPCDLRDNIILVGDPSRVKMIASLLDSITRQGSNREFVWASGVYGGKEITVISTGIGADNIDIVMNELDALVSIDFETRRVKQSFRKLNIVRIGTCGVVQSDIKTGEVIVSESTIGTDPVPNYYQRGGAVFNDDLSEKFVQHTSWSKKLSVPYAVDASSRMLDLFGKLGRCAITVSAPGFYAPQGRHVRIAPACENFIPMIQSFRYNERRILNLEMESAPIAAMARIMGHDAITLCVAIVQRAGQKSDLDYNTIMKKLAKSVLDHI
ncbi:MAG: nucleoside phosphorylase [Rikenellaceae bacterium]